MSGLLHASTTSECCGEGFLSILWLGGVWAVPHPGDLAPPKSHIDSPLGVQSPYVFPAAQRTLNAKGGNQCDSLMAFPTRRVLVSLALLPFLIFVSLGHQILL